MRLLQLDISNFRAIASASVAFGPGLNVLYGPNELGKSTLAEAVKAALLVPSQTRAEDFDFSRWDGTGPARVVLTFESGSAVWRVTKTFASNGDTVLERREAAGSPFFRHHSAGKKADADVRELLRWGVKPPGKGQPPKALGYLVTALLGRQGQVQSVLEASLKDDKDPSAKLWLTDALGGFAADPAVTQVLDQLESRVARVFAPGGQLRRAIDSPLAILQDKVNRATVRLTDMRKTRADSILVEQRVVELQAELASLADEERQAERLWVEAADQVQRASRRDALLNELRACKAQLQKARELDDALAALRVQLEAAEQTLSTAKQAEEGATSALTAAGTVLAAASEDLAAAKQAEKGKADLADAERLQRLAQLRQEESALRTRLAHIESVESDERTLVRLEDELSVADAAVDAAAMALRTADRIRLGAQHRAALAPLLAHQAQADRLATGHAEAQNAESAARTSLAEADAAVAAAIADREAKASGLDDPAIAQAAADLELTRAVASQLEIQAAEGEVVGMEAAIARAAQWRAAAQTKRRDGQRSEDEYTRQILPSPEQIAQWRALDARIQAGTDAAAESRHFPLVRVALAMSVGLAVSVIALGLGASAQVAAAVGVITAVVVAGIAIARARSVRGTSKQDREGHDPLTTRWSQEVIPALRAAGMKSLADYEAAVQRREQLKNDAIRLKSEADGDDAKATAEEHSGAGLEDAKRRLLELTNDAPTADPVSVKRRLAELGTDRAAVARLVEATERQLEELRSRHLAGLEDAIRRAQDAQTERRTALTTCSTNTASAFAALSVAKAHCDPERVEALRSQLQVLSCSELEGPTPDEAAAAYKLAQDRHSGATTSAAGCRAMRDSKQADVARALEALGAPLVDARRDVELALSEITTEIAALDAPDAIAVCVASTRLTEATKRHAEAEADVAAKRSLKGQAASARLTAESAANTIRTDIATRTGERKGIDWHAVESRVATLEAHEDYPPDLREPIDEPVAKAQLTRARERTAGCHTSLTEARGQLRLVAGQVDDDALAQQEEAARLAQEECESFELMERGAKRLLETVRAIEKERAEHLGRLLAVPVSETFKDLTQGRYGSVRLGPELTLEHIEVAGAARHKDELSVGTIEQLATLIRLAIAANLRTAVVLDDQLVHSDSDRLAWFRDRLRASAETYGHQIVVLTCRLEDHSETVELLDGSPVTVVDLAQHIVN